MGFGSVLQRSRHVVNGAHVFLHQVHAMRRVTADRARDSPEPLAFPRVPIVALPVLEDAPARGARVHPASSHTAHVHPTPPRQGGPRHGPLGTRAARLLRVQRAYERSVCAVGTQPLQLCGQTPDVDGSSISGWRGG